MADFNNHTVTGNLVEDAKQINDKMVAFKIASDDSYKDKNNVWVNRADFIDVVSFLDKLNPSILSKFKKGMRVQISGKPSAKAYIDKNGGAQGSISINLKNIHEWPYRKVKQEATGAAPTAQANTQAQTEDDLPF